MPDETPKKPEGPKPLIRDDPPYKEIPITIKLKSTGEPEKS